MDNHSGADDAVMLSAFWDAVSRDDPDPPAAGLDQETLELVHRVRRVSVADVPAGARDRVWRAVQAGLNGGPHERTTEMQGTIVLDRPAITPATNGHTDPRRNTQPMSIASQRGYRSVVSFAAAAVLLLVLASGLFAIRFGMPEPDEGRFSSIPAAQVSPEATPPAGPVEFLWATRGDPADPLGNPAFLAVAPDGTIWVADGDHNRFLIFAPDGSLVESWGETGSGEGQFDFTTRDWGGYDHGAIAFAPDGTFYVADPGNFRIQRFDSDRRFLIAWGSEGEEPGQFRTANDLVVDGLGRVYVLDSDRSPAPAVQAFDADGRFLAAWGSEGTQPGQLSGPSGIGLDPDGTLLIAEFSGSRVQRFTPEGELLDGWGEGGSLDGKFNWAHDVAVDAEGRVFVSDYSNHRVQIFDRDGQFLAAWGEMGEGPGEFAYTLGVAVDGDGAIYVADEGKRLQAFRVGTLPGAQEATPATANKAAQVSPEATPPAGPVEFLWETRGDPESPMENALYPDIAPDGTIWVPDGQNGRFQIFSPDGALLEIWGSEGAGPGEFDFVREGFGGYGQGAIAFDDAGNFYVADTGNDRIQKFGPDRTFLTSWGGTGVEDGLFLGVTDLAVDAQGRVYTVDAARSDIPADADVGAVQVFDSNGKFLAAWGVRGKEPGQMSSPIGIGFDKDGNVIVTEFDNNRLQRFTPDGVYIDGWGTFGTNGGEFFHPNDAAVDEQGNIYVTDWSNSRVQVFDHDGRFLTTWGDYGLDPGRFSGASSLVLDGLGNIYVTDDFGRLQKFRILTLPEPAATPTA